VVEGCGGWRSPDESWLDMEAAEDGETFFVNMMAERRMRTGIV
jgi:hypothetical protein